MAGYITKRIFYKALTIAFFLITCNTLAFAQGPGHPGDCENPSEDDPNCDPETSVPIDGGASVLIAAGVAYGVKKAYDKRKQSKEADIA